MVRGFVAVVVIRGGWGGGFGGCGGLDGGTG